MTRKHFEAIARVLRDTGASSDTVEAMASTLARFNGAFDRARFVHAASPAVVVVHKDGSSTGVARDYDGRVIFI